MAPTSMRIWRGTRPLKRWRYVGVFCDEVMLCVGDARVGPLRQRFWAVAEPDRPIVERTTFGRGGVLLEGSRVRVDTRDVRVDVTLDEEAGIETTHADHVWTRKQAGIGARGEVRVGSRSYSLSCHAVVDDTAGYHRRHTRWMWSAGVGRSTEGQRVAWNLVTGVNDEERGSERAVWIDGEPFEPAPVTFSEDMRRIEFAEGGALEFSEWSARENRTNALLLRSRYRQPFGTFTGSFPRGVSLQRGFGVVELHDAHW
jgi:Protein of unknown function (DUF2804)